MLALEVVPGSAGGRLRPAELAEPEPGPHEVVIRIAAAAVNRADISMLRGSYRQPALTRADGRTVAGLECAGTITAIGSDVTRWRPGQRVMTKCGGAFAEAVAVNERQPQPIPDALPCAHAAALPVGLMTETDALVRGARWQPADRVVISAAGSGVGLIAVQLCRYLGCTRVVGTVLGDEQARVVRELGADATVTGDRPDLADALLAETGGGADIVLDHVGAAALDAHLRACAVGARLVSVGRLGGTAAEIDLDLLARQQISLVGVTFRSRTLAGFGEATELAEQYALPGVRTHINARIAATFPLHDAEAAVDLLGSAGTFGKIVLLTDHGSVG